MVNDVLVTGGSGFVAGWCIVELLKNGHTVRATIRDPRKADAVRAAVSRVVDLEDRLRFVTADLLADDGWDEAVAGCENVLHVASPLIATRDEEQVIRPAVDGVRRVLRASRDAGVLYRCSDSSVPPAPLRPGVNSAGGGGHGKRP